MSVHTRIDCQSLVILGLAVLLAAPCAAGETTEPLWQFETGG